MNAVSIIYVDPKVVKVMNLLKGNSTDFQIQFIFDLRILPNI
jgi:hypothetical protein